MIIWRSGWQICLLAGLLLLSGCQTPVQTARLLASPPAIASQHKILQVPFYPQQEYLCGPTTLSEVAGFYGLHRTPEAIAPDTFIPSLQGSLQIEMAAATRKLGFLAYTQRGSLEQLLSLVADNIPVIVLQNNAIEWFAQWHYAVVIGYDLKSAEVILHTGEMSDYRLNLATFERTWQRGNYWMLVMLPPDRASRHLSVFEYVKAGQDLLSTGQPAAGIRALSHATAEWPQDWLAYFLLGNHYFSSDPQQAVNWFANGIAAGRSQSAYLNNYAMLLSGLGCHQQAEQLIEQAVRLAPTDPNVLDSQTQIRAEAVSKAEKQCPMK